VGTNEIEGNRVGWLDGETDGNKDVEGIRVGGDVGDEVGGDDIVGDGEGTLLRNKYEMINCF